MPETFEPTQARGVRRIDEPPALFPEIDRRCAPFSQWWARVTQGMNSAADLPAANEVTQ